MTTQQIQAIARDWGTPTYVFDLGVLKRRVDYLKSHLPQRVQLCYAIKANTFITGALNEIMPRFEICSPGEYRVCQALDIPGRKMVISGVYKTPSFIRELAQQRSDIGVYTVESEEQLALLKCVARECNRTLPVLLRLTSGNQFGLDRAKLVEAIDQNDSALLDIRGIQYFSGTQKSSLKKLKRELDKLEALIDELEQEHGFVCRELEYGPGLPAFYFEGDSFDEDAHLAGLSELIDGLHIKCELTFELGRGIAASCGTYLTSVVDKKTNKGQNYAILDGGMNHLVYFGQSMAMRMPHMQIIPPRDNRDGEVWNLCGALCTANDILVKQLPVSDLAVGDVFAFENTGAYCMIEGISLFLSRDLPQVLLLGEDGVPRQVRQGVPTYPLNTPETH
jgi:diaminopimelate decarboxylase